METTQRAAKEEGIAAAEKGVVFAKCDCCGLTEECTEEYVESVRDRYSGRWICGLCSEAVKDEEGNAGTEEEALDKHASFCKKFKARSPPESPTDELIDAVKHLLMRCLDSPRARKPGLARSRSCHPALDSGRL